MDSLKMFIVVVAAFMFPMMIFIVPLFIHIFIYIAPFLLIAAIIYCFVKVLVLSEKVEKMEKLLLRRCSKCKVNTSIGISGKKPISKNPSWLKGKKFKFKEKI